VCRSQASNETIERSSSGLTAHFRHGHRHKPSALKRSTAPGWAIVGLSSGSSKPQVKSRSEGKDPSDLVPGVGFELRHQGFWPVSLDIAQVPDQRKRESPRSASDALYPAVMRRL